MKYETIHASDRIGLLEKADRMMENGWTKEGEAYTETTKPTPPDGHGNSYGGETTHYQTMKKEG